MDNIAKLNIQWITENWKVQNPLSVFREYKPTEVIRILGLKHHHVVNLVEKGIIKPVIEVSGRGHSRIYSYKNLFEISFFYHLVRRGYGHNSARNILNSLGTLPDNPNIFNLLFVVQRYFHTPATDESCDLPTSEVSQGLLEYNKEILKSKVSDAADTYIFSLNVFDLAGINEHLLINLDN